MNTIKSRLDKAYAQGVEYGKKIAIEMMTESLQRINRQAFTVTPLPRAVDRAEADPHANVNAGRKPES